MADTVVSAPAEIEVTQLQLHNDEVEGTTNENKSGHLFHEILLLLGKLPFTNILLEPRYKAIS